MYVYKHDEWPLQADKGIIQMHGEMHGVGFQAKLSNSCGGRRGNPKEWEDEIDFI